MIALLQTLNTFSLDIVKHYILEGLTTGLFHDFFCTAIIHGKNIAPY